MKVYRASSVNPVESMNSADPLWLVSQCIAGNQDAIKYLFQQYEMGVYKLALSILDDPAEASEVTQETFDAALGAMQKYQERQSFKAWLYTIAVNRSRSHLRKRKAVQRLQATLTAVFRIEFEKQEMPEDAVIQSEKEAALWKSLNQLEEIHRIVVVLRYFHELPVRDISEILAIPEGTIHSRLHSAREILRTTLKNLDGE